MADLATEFLGIPSPNPFWLASAPPTDKAYNVNRAFEAGWGGDSLHDRRIILARRLVLIIGPGCTATLVAHPTPKSRAVRNGYEIEIVLQQLIRRISC